MPDNVAVTPGTGATVAADEVADATLGTVKVQYVKLMDGTLDGTNKVQVGASGGLSVKGVAVPGISGSVAAGGTATIGPLNVADAGNVTFVAKNTTAATAFAGAPVLVFEQSDDNVSWGPLTVVRAVDTAVASTFTVAPVGANGAMIFDASAEAVNWVRVRVTTGPTTNPMTVAIGAGGMPFPVALAVVPKRDAGRVAKTFWVDAFAATSTTDTLLTMSMTTDGATNTTAASYTVPAGKRLRIQQVSFWVSTTTGNTTAVQTTMRLKTNTAGAVTTGSATPIQATMATAAAANTSSAPLNLPLPDGFEIPGGTAIGVTMAAAAFTAGSAVARGHAVIVGFEY